MPSARWSSSRRRGRTCRASSRRAASWSATRTRARRCWPRWPTTAPTTTRRATGPGWRTCAGAAPASCRSRLGTSLPLADVEDALLAAIRFRAYPEVPAVLERLRAGGARLAVVSQLGRLAARRPRAHRRCAPLVDAVVISAELGAAKPDPAIFRAALERLGGHGRRGDPRRRQRRGRRRRRARGGPGGGARRPRRRAGARRRARRGVPRRPAHDVGHTGRLVLCIRARMSTAPSSIPPPSFDVAPELPEGVERRPPPGARAGSRGRRGPRSSPPSPARSSGRSSSASSAPPRARASPTPARR